MRTYPTEKYPTIVSGKIVAPIVRYESLDGSVLEDPIPGGVMLLRNFTPFERNGKTWGLPHQQKYSTSGWLRTDPDCFHWWIFKRIQKRQADGTWIPGSEVGLYFRKPFSWRWDVAGTVVDGELRHWIWTKGYLGGHWD